MEYCIRAEDDVNIYANDINPCGQQTILFIHGWPANHQMFEYQYDQLISSGYRCVGVDTRGFGKSDKPLTGYNYDRLADDILCVIKALKLKNITLAGHSTGGAIAIRYMSRHHGFGVSKLVLMAAAAPSLVKLPRFPYGQNADDIRKNFIEAAYVDRPQMLQNFGNIFFYQPVSQPFSDWFQSLGLEAASWATISVANMWLKEQLFSDLARIQAPTLIMHGVHDQVVPFQLGMIQHKNIRNSRLVPFENSGHGLFYDEMGKCNLELKSFAQ
jgi:Predicted hydrolases or acyltransferases (alpha/beta hydrolase superfamily)